MQETTEQMPEQGITIPEPPKKEEAQPAISKRQAAAVVLDWTQKGRIAALVGATGAFATAGVATITRGWIAPVLVGIAFFTFELMHFQNFHKEHQRIALQYGYTIQKNKTQDEKNPKSEM